MTVVERFGPNGGSSDDRAIEFRIPSLRGDVLPLAEVLDRLDRATGGVAVVSAPAGYGKSTQVALWAAAGDRPTAWLDLAPLHNDPAVLTAYLASMVECLTQIDVLTALTRSTPTHPLAFVASVSELLHLIDGPVVIVLDDVHVIDDPMALEVLGGVVDNVPARSTIVVVGRREPDISFGRLRIEDRVQEIGATELALTGSDARSIFESFGVDIDDALLHELVASIEGLPFGLRLAALAWRDDEEPSRSLAPDRILIEAVHAEWLRGLAPDDVDFLMRVSGLDWMSGLLCDEVLGRSDSGDRLARLHRSLLLVAPLDRRGSSYRMHALLREVLDEQHERVDSAGRSAIDRSASAWFERHGDVDRAIRHAVRSGDDDLVMRLVTRHAATTHTRGRFVTVRRWLDDLPATTVRGDASMCAIAALTSMGLGDGEEARAWIRFGLAASGTSDDATTSSTARLELLTLNGLISTGPVGEVLDDLNEAYAHLPPGIWHAGACWGLGVLDLALGLDDLAERKLVEGAAEARVLGAHTIRANCRSTLALVLGERADWVGATATAREARQLVREHELDHMPSLIAVTAMSAHVEALAGDPVAARADLLLTRRNMAYLGTVAAWANVQARISLAHASLLLGDRAGARVLADEAEAYLRMQSDAVGSRARLQEVIDHLTTARDALPLGPTSLTTAELRVLHLLPTNLTIAEIAQRLFVSRNTAKSHAAAVYRKLGVPSRGEAVRVARDAGLLSTVIDLRDGR